jgi:hypothetical protein
MTDTIVDRGFIEQAVDQTPEIELVPEYSEQAWLAIRGDVKAMVEFFIRLAPHDPALATDLADVMKRDEVYADGESIWWFFGYKLEEVF